MANMLTSKEAVLIADLLNYEALASKKCALYSRTLTDPRLSNFFDALSKNHQKRYNSLLELLNY